MMVSAKAWGCPFFCFVYLSEIVNISERYIRWFGGKDHFPPRGDRISMWAVPKAFGIGNLRTLWANLFLASKEKEGTSFRAFDINFSLSTRCSWCLSNILQPNWKRTKKDTTMYGLKRKLFLSILWDTGHVFWKCIGRRRLSKYSLTEVRDIFIIVLPWVEIRPYLEGGCSTKILYYSAFPRLAAG